MKQPTDATVCSQFYSTAKVTLHVSGATQAHHQEYNVQLYLQPLVQTIISAQIVTATFSQCGLALTGRK
jgi:hypothetical protein